MSYFVTEKIFSDPKGNYNEYEIRNKLKLIKRL